MDSLNLCSSLYAHANANPRGVALTAGGREFSYEELAVEAAGVGAWLLSLRLRDDRPPRVGILAGRSLECYAGILGTAWAGGTFVPLNPRLPSARLAAILQLAGLDAVVADRKGCEHFAALAPNLPSHVLLGRGLAADLPEANVSPWESAGERSLLHTPPRPVPDDHPVYVIFTSGTTGVPKGVVVTAGNVAHFLSCIAVQYHLSPQDRVSQFSETSFDVSIFEMFASWAGGASLHVVPEALLMAPAGFIREQQLTVWSSVPSVIRILTRMKHLKPGVFPSLRISYFAGEGLPVAAARAWQAAAPASIVDNQYGPTEGTITCIHQLLTEPPIETPGRGMLAIGKPYPGMSAGILSPDRQFMQPGEQGELALCGPQVAAGYLDDPQQTARRFPTLDHPQLGRSRWYLTGDLATCDRDGNFHHLGRVDHQVKVMGNRVELEEVEAHLREICGTEEVAAVAWPLIDGNPVGIVAFICGGRLSTATARETLARRVPGYMVPRRLLMIEALPLSTNGKVDRKQLITLLDGGAHAAGI
jgi:amino acid adenylation domain-containing protein